MTMSFKDWYDSKSEDTKDYINAQCKGWIDLSSPDLYKPQIDLNTVSSVIYFTMEGGGEQYAYAMSLIMKLGGTLDDISEYIDNEWRSIRHGALRIFPVEDRKKIVRDFFYKKKNSGKYYDQTFGDWLFMQEDYANLDVSTLNAKIPLNFISEEILGKDNIVLYAKNDPDGIDYTIFPKDGSRSELFDSLFFGEDGWTEEQKDRVIQNICRCRPNGYYGRITERTLTEIAHVFLKNICTVDKKNLEYFYELIESQPQLANQLYNEKKPADELTGNETVEMTYRYPKWLRKLFLIMGCCARKNVSMANADKLKKEGAALLKLYNYNFHQYFISWLAQNPEY